MIIVSPYRRSSLSVIVSKACNCPPALTSWCQYLPISTHKKKRRRRRDGCTVEKKNKKRKQRNNARGAKQRKEEVHTSSPASPIQDHASRTPGCQQRQEGNEKEGGHVVGPTVGTLVAGLVGTRPNIAPGCYEQEAVGHRITLLRASRLGRHFPLSEKVFRTIVGGIFLSLT